jgi:hypothetical protein
MLCLEWGIQHLYLGGKGYQTSYIHMELTPTILCSLDRITSRYREITVHYFSQYLVADEIFRRRKKSLADRNVLQVGGHSTNKIVFGFRVSHKSWYIEY